MANDILKYKRSIATDEALGIVGEVYQCLNPYTGTFWFVIQPFWANTDSSDHMLFDIYKNSTNQLSLFFRASDDKFVLRLNHSGIGIDIVISLAQTFSAGTWIFGAVRWNFTTDSYGISINNDAEQTDATGRTAPTYTDSDANKIQIGYDNTSIFKGRIYFKFDDVPYTTTDYTAFYNSGNGKAFYVGPETILCPAHCCDSQGSNSAKLASTNTVGLCYPKLLPDNTVDFVAATDNNVDDGNQEEASLWAPINAPTTNEKISTDCYEGLKSSHVAETGAGINRGIYKNITLVANTDFVVTVAHKDAGGTDARIKITETNWGVVVKDTQDNQASWTYYNFVYQCNATTTKSIGVQHGVATMDFWLDYVSFVKSLLTTGSFDAGTWIVTSGLNDNWLAYTDGTQTYAQTGYGRADTNSHSYGTLQAGIWDAQNVIVGASGTYWGIRQTVSSLAVGYYTVLGWVDTDTNNTDFYIEVNGTTLGTLTSNALRVAAADGWVRQGFTFYNGAAENITIRLYAKNITNGNKVYFDDFALILLDNVNAGVVTAKPEASSFINEEKPITL